MAPPKPPRPPDPLVHGGPRRPARRLRRVRPRVPPARTLGGDRRGAPGGLGGRRANRGGGPRADARRRGSMGETRPRRRSGGSPWTPDRGPRRERGGPLPELLPGSDGGSGLPGPEPALLGEG